MANRDSKDPKDPKVIKQTNFRIFVWAYPGLPVLMHAALVGAGADAGVGAGAQVQRVQHG